MRWLYKISLNARFNFFKRGDAGAETFHEPQDQVAALDVNRVGIFVGVELADGRGDGRGDGSRLHEANVAALVGTGIVGIFLYHLAKLRAALQFRLGVLGALLGLLRLVLLCRNQDFREVDHARGFELVLVLHCNIAASLPASP